MKNYIIPISISVIILLGYVVHRETELRKQQEVNQLIEDATQSLDVIQSNKNNQGTLFQVQALESAPL